jgi:hypothetical protein
MKEAPPEVSREFTATAPPQNSEPSSVLSRLAKHKVCINFGYDSSLSISADASSWSETASESDLSESELDESSSFFCSAAILSSPHFYMEMESGFVEFHLTLQIISWWANNDSKKRSEIGNLIV